MRKLLFLGWCAIVSATAVYPRCNDMIVQHEYLETERWMFGVSPDVSPFDSETLFPNRTVFMPSACHNDNGDYINFGKTAHFIAKNTHLELLSPTNRFTGLDKYATYATDFLWRMLGWKKHIVDGEHYW